MGLTLYGGTELNMVKRPSSLHWSLQDDLWMAHRTWSAGEKDIGLVHGFLAHSFWWDFCVQELSSPERVLAPDLSGMGHSEWQKQYSLRQHALSLLRYAPSPMWWIGHSYGGFVCWALAHYAPEKVLGIILIDSPLMAWHPEPIRPSMRLGYSTYSSLEEMRQAFRLMPEQPFASDALGDQLFHASITSTQTGYRWLFDPRISMLWDGDDWRLLHQKTETPVCYIAGSNSECSKPEDRVWLSYYAPQTTFHTIKDAHHAVLLDQPQALASCIEACLLKALITTS